jgi:hypothetical protein
MTEPKRITILGTFDKTGEPDEIFSIPDINASPDEIRAAIEAANAARAEALAQESRKLREMFLSKEGANE